MASAVASLQSTQTPPLHRAHLRGGTGGSDETLYALIEEEVLDERVLTCDAAIETAVALTRSRPRCSAWRRGAAYGNSLAKLLASLLASSIVNTPPVPASLSFSRA